MTCFWDAIRSNLRHEDYHKIDLKHSNITHQEFIEQLKKKNKGVTQVKWQGEYPSKLQRTENYIHIRCFDVSTIHNGYDCSIADPFLFLVADLMNISIHHNFDGHMIVYEKDLAYRSIRLNSDRGHIS